MKDCEFDIDYTITNYYSNGSSGLYRAIYKTNDSALTLDDVKITGDCYDGATYYTREKTNDTLAGVYNDGSGDITIINSEFHNTSHNNLLYAFGVFNAGSSTISLGSKDGNYLENSQVIDGSTYGVYSTSGTINFYDGTIQSDNKPMFGSFNEIEDDYYIYKYSDSGKNIIKLKNPVYNIYDVTHQQYYSTLYDALTHIGDDPTVLRYENDENYEPATNIPKVLSTQNVEINLNGKEVNLGGGLENYGTLTILDTETTKGSVTSQKIVNKGTLNITAGTYKFNYSLKVNTH